MAKLTKQTVDALKSSKVGVKGSYLIEWDQELRGFGVKVVASGLKTFVIQYRNAQGRSRRIMIGRYGVMTLEEARREAKAILGRIARGVDPLEEKQAAASGAITVAEVCDWYLAEAEAGRILGKRRRPIKASTLAMDRSRIDVHIRPLLGKRAVSALKLGDIEGAQADIAAGKTSKPRAGSRGGAATGGEGVAARTMSTLHAIFEHGVRLGKIESNPARGVRRLASTPRDRRLSRAEIEKLGQAIRAAEQEGEHPTGLAAIRFFLMTGLRRMEGLALERAWLHDEEGSIRFPDTKSGAQTRVIGRAAVDLLLAQPQAGSRFFFPADWGEGHFVGIVRVLDRVCALARLEDVTPHTLRHTFASVAGDLGFSELTIAALLGHAARGVTQRYIHIDEALRLAADRVAVEMTDILDGKAASARPPRRGARQSQEFRETDQGVPQAES
ncbi:site-specific integrase [Xanthobacter dioxanivorans]|uniref:Site-specific integrase n=1 Tax=Xanthobacter dioxanivorans TaxID=2528964 RepID=A0A974PP67_9HYPH|nr:site-specific integrase [Xanthobacter dioxanivorans]QRG07214.1 site-specific integrase [Xanthobacter dioxanivorans]